MKTKKIYLIIFSYLMVCSSHAQKKEPTQDEKMGWWRDARFGMFVHWGLYSAAAGEWNGKTNKGGGQEWIQFYEGIPTAEYEKVLKPQFKPTENFAAEWARVAKSAGCKYIVFTTKHHEGFALHDSKVSDYDARDFYGRDLVKEIVDACRNEGLRVGFYHSVIDWHHPHAFVGGGLPSIKGDTNEGRDHSKYVGYLHNQVGELLTNYGDVDILWWDYSSPETQGEAWKANELIAKVRKHQPDIIMNNRLFAKAQTGGVSAEGFDLKQGDFVTPEQKIPENGIEGVDWETCMTMNGTWGYSKHDNNWKSTETLVRNLIDVVSKGGNYLLNIGPKADGSVPVESVERMQQIGDWIEINGESIYGTTANPLSGTPWGRCTQKEISKNINRLYLHIFDFPEDGILNITGENLDVSKAFYLNGKSKIKFKKNSEGVKLFLSEDKKSEYATVVVLDIQLK